MAEGTIGAALRRNGTIGIRVTTKDVFLELELGRTEALEFMLDISRSIDKLDSREPVATQSAKPAKPQHPNLYPEEA